LSDPNLYSKYLVTDSNLPNTDSEDYLSNEIPIAISYNGITHVVMMASPTDLEEFVAGFSFTEGIISKFEDIFDIEIKKNENGIQIDVEIAQENFQKLKEVKRNLSGKTGCGICGIESLDYFAQRLLAQYPKKQNYELKKKIIQKSLEVFNANQDAQSKTGSIHAAALFDKDAHLISIKEDVGRHNAMDKLIGSKLMKNLLGHFIVCSSRASYEMVQKVLTTEIPILIAISAPTSMAVNLAVNNSLTLIGFAREKRFVTYAHKHRII
jgi:formate dehydrogenase accessory protein FdhD